MKNKFVIITNQRSGSNMLVSMLDGHPEVKCLGELMRVTPEWMKHDGYRGVLTILEKVDPKFKDDNYRFSNPDEFVHEAFKIFPNKSHYGFKLHLNQHKNYLYRLISDPEWKVILLKRENILAQYSSLKIAKVTGQGNAPKGTKIKKATIIFDLNDFKRFLISEKIRWEEVHNRLYETGKTFFTVNYTQLLSKKHKTEMLNYLGADPIMDLEPGTEKRNPSDILSRFVNRKDAERGLAKLSLSHWTQETFEQ